MTKLKSRTLADVGLIERSPRAIGLMQHAKKKKKKTESSSSSVTNFLQRAHLRLMRENHSELLISTIMEEFRTFTADEKLTKEQRNGMESFFAEVRAILVSSTPSKRRDFLRRNRKGFLRMNVNNRR